MSVFSLEKVWFAEHDQHTLLSSTAVPRLCSELAEYDESSRARFGRFVEGL